MRKLSVCVWELSSGDPCTSLFWKTLFPLQNKQVNRYKHLQHFSVQAVCICFLVKAARTSVTLNSGNSGVDLHMWLVSHYDFYCRHWWKPGPLCCSQRDLPPTGSLCLWLGNQQCLCLSVSHNCTTCLDRLHTRGSRGFGWVLCGIYYHYCAFYY